ncbi:MAG: hypothetical protein WC462_00930 [archaeon]
MHKNLDKFSILMKAIFLLKKHPVLFLPKLILAFLYGFGILLSTQLLHKMISFTSILPEEIVLDDLRNFFLLALFLLVLTVFSYFVDLFFSGLYPLLVNQAVKGKISFSKAFFELKPKLVKLFISGVIVFLFISIFSFVEALVLFFLNFSDFGTIVSFIVTFIFIFLLYFLFPIISSKKLGVVSSFRKTIFSSFKNKHIVFLFSLIPFSVSIIKFVLAFFADNTGLLVLFWVLVFLTGIVYTIHAVVNQLLYLNLNKRKE